MLDQFWIWRMQAGLLGSYECIKAFSETDFTSDLETFDVPTLILHGDQIVPVRDSSRKTARIIKGAKDIYYPGAPHGSTATPQDQVNAELLSRGSVLSLAMTIGSVWLPNRRPAAGSILLKLAAVGVARLSYPSAYRLSRSSGGFGRLHADTLDRLCAFFKVQPGELLRWTPPRAADRWSGIRGRTEPNGAGRPDKPPSDWRRRSECGGGRCARTPGTARDTRMPGVGAPPHVATRADFANQYHWVAILRAGRHDYSSSARSGRATAGRARRMVMAMTSREALDGAVTAAQAA